MHPNEELIAHLYSAFESGDHAPMGACCDDDASLSDPVFPSLSADEVRAV